MRMNFIKSVCVAKKIVVILWIIGNPRNTKKYIFRGGLGKIWVFQQLPSNMLDYQCIFYICFKGLTLRKEKQLSGQMRRYQVFGVKFCLPTWNHGSQGLYRPQKWLHWLGSRWHNVHKRVCPRSHSKSIQKMHFLFRKGHRHPVCMSERSKWSSDTAIRQ